MRTVGDKESLDLAYRSMSWSVSKTQEPKIEELSEREMEAVMVVFRSFETGLREATIYAKVLCWRKGQLVWKRTKIFVYLI